LIRNSSCRTTARRSPPLLKPLPCRHRTYHSKLAACGNTLENKGFPGFEPTSAFGYVKLVPRYRQLVSSRNRITSSSTYLSTAS
jgi:hypothetical protein